MSRLADLYQLADAMVQDNYALDPEDHWKLKAIDEHRAGKQTHDSVMSDFVRDIEIQVDKLLKDTPVVIDGESPNKKEIEVRPVVKPTQPH